jgi:hypothetical protein
MALMARFRVHFDDGQALDVQAETPAKAREEARRRRPGNILKVKQVREEAANG